tara:strand:- start:513 stop:1724 length:1212 start_codon:yes stop_codon:yes gene_type:complete
MSSGLKGAANAKRQEQIDPLLKMTGELNARSSYLEAQMQEEQKKSMQVKQLFSQNSHNLMNFSSANLAKDSHALNEVSPALLRSYKQMFGDQTIGSYSHTHDGTIFYENNETNKIEGVNIANLIAQSGIDPKELFGDNAEQVMSGLSSGSREKHQNTQELQRQQLEKGQADINNVNSQANYHNAQSGKIEHDIANPQLSPAQTKTKELNEVKFHTRHENAEEKRVLNNAYDQYIDNILDAKKKGLTGKSPIAEWNRYFAEKTGQSENMDIEEMLRITHANRVKELGGSNANIKQFEVAMASAPSITKDPDATIKFLDKVIEQNNEYLDETDYLGQIWENSNWQGQERSVLNNYRAQNKAKSNKADRKNTTQDTSYVIMVNQETGEKMEVPSDKASLFKQNGYE